MLRTFVWAVVYAVYDRLYSGDRADILISPAYSVLEPDTQQLILKLTTLSGSNTTVSICVDDIESVDLSELHISSDQILLVERDSLELVRTLAKTQLVILRGQNHLRWYRIFGRRSKRDFILFYHGIITKAYGTHVDSDPNHGGNRIRSWVNKQKRYANLTVQSVASEIELFFRSSAEQRHPRHFEELGYPRFDRIAELIENPDRTRLSEEFVNTVSDGRTTVMYAPTHKDGAYETELFPFEENVSETIHTRLREENLQLLVRMHPNEEDAEVYDQLVDGENVVYAGQSVCHSPTELLPFVDILVTDYSSIYVDFLPFDRPIIFLPERHERFRKHRGIAFDYERYFPGQTVESSEEFFAAIRDISTTGDDDYSENRAFVRRVLLPEWEQSTVRKIVERFGVNHPKEESTQ